MASPITLHAPIYLLRAMTDCWSCGRSTEFYAIAATRVEDEEGMPFDDDEPALLRRITDLPVEITEAMAAHGAVLHMQSSKTVGPYMSASAEKAKGQLSVNPGSPRRYLKRS